MRKLLFVGALSSSSCAQDTDVLQSQADFEHFTDCVISQAVVGFGKPAKAELYPTLGDKAKAMVVHLTVSAGRQKSGLPVNKYAIVNYTKQEEEKKMEKLYV